jgi:methylated-DNA-[protein]-cysteine S-methyltransferase
MGERRSAVISTPLPGGPRLGLICGPGGLERVQVLPPDTPLLPATDKVAAHFSAQFECYFRGELADFDGPLASADTRFRGQVRAGLRAIPAGTTLTYGALAKKLESAPRAVAGACRANPLPLVVPCHRVIAAGGAGGYMGQMAGTALEYKCWLLRHEGAA